MAVFWCTTGAFDAVHPASAASDKPPVPAEVTQKGFSQLVFSDDFNVLDMSPNDSGNFTWFNALWYSTRSDPSLFSVANGVLTLSARPTKGGALIATLARRPPGRDTTFTHGYFEAKLAMNASPDNFSAFWLFSSEHARGTDNNHWCEIDIFELFTPGTFTGTIHEWIDFKNTQNGNNLQPLGRDVDVSQWHVYGLLWEPGRVTWYFDGRPVMSAPSPDVCERQKLFLILNSGVRNDRYDQWLHVDWVRVFAKGAGQ
jgi:beta-glucanase (GH16 family)